MRQGCRGGLGVRQKKPRRRTNGGKPIRLGVKKRRAPIPLPGLSERARNIALKKGEAGG
jgi:hypothetical protein